MGSPLLHPTVLPAASSSSRGAPSCQARVQNDLSKSQQMPGGSSWLLSYTRAAPTTDSFASAGSQTPTTAKAVARVAAAPQEISLLSSRELMKAKTPRVWAGKGGEKGFFLLRASEAHLRGAGWKGQQGKTTAARDLSSPTILNHYSRPQLSAAPGTRVMSLHGVTEPQHPARGSPGPGTGRALGSGRVELQALFCHPLAGQP